MKTTINAISKLGLALVIISLCSSFTGIKNDGLNCTYGVSEDDPSQIKLSLKDDYTFTYQDFSRNTRQIFVKGTYTHKNNKVQLKSEHAQYAFHDTWKIVDDGAFAKARRGLSFYTLGRK